MGVLEEQFKRRQRSGHLQKIILQTVASAGVLGIALLAPNILVSLKKLGLIRKPSSASSICNARKKLIDAGLLLYESGYLKLTPKGEIKLGLLEAHSYKLKKPRRWDKKWRVLIFDISEKRKSLREKVRLTLVQIGFVRLQNSVWVYPYDCEDLVVLLKADFRVGKELLYLIVDTIENDSWLLKNFKLV